MACYDRHVREGSPSYVHRAALLALLWTEICDDVPAAEECSQEGDLLARRDMLRRDLRAFLERTDPGGGADKWVQRAFWSAPPRKHCLDARWKPTLQAWVDALELDRESVHDIMLAVRSLFADGSGAFAELITRRPRLMSTLELALGGGLQDDAICRMAGTQLLEDSYLPMYLTDAPVQRIVWSNRSFQAFIGIASDALLRLSFPGLIERCIAMVPPELRGAFQERHEELLVAGHVVGRGFITTTVDLGLRTWVLAQQTPPWEGRYLLECFAHFAMDRRLNQRLGSFVVYHLRRPPSP